MTAMIPSFLSSAKLVIKMGTVQLAYGTNLSFNDRMATAPVGGIGSYNSDALEPLQYSAGGSFTITVYNSTALKALNKNVPSRALDGDTIEKNATTDKYSRSGNSMLTATSFSPLKLITSQTFDIDIYERMTTANTTVQDLYPLYILEGCRLNSYSMTFTPGSLVQENIGFLCMQVRDRALQYEASVGLGIGQTFPQAGVIVSTK